MNEAIWISWENHRRTRELADALGVPLIIETSQLITGLSHFHLVLQTIVTLIKEKPKNLIVQNPSIVLAFFASLLKPIFRYRLIVDRHTNFRLGKSVGYNPVYILHKLFSDFSLRYADLTIVTNDFLKRVVEDKGGQGFVLVDKLPVFKNLTQKRLQGEFNAVFICTYADDEPYEEVVQAASLLPSSTCIYITGRIPSKFNPENVPDNVILTDYLSETDYVNLLYSADVIMDFTTLDWCLVCGGYEAVSLGRPLITSDTVALRNLLGEAAVYSKHAPLKIAGSINLAQDMHDNYMKKVEVYRDVFLSRWNISFLELQTLLTRIIRPVE